MTAEGRALRLAVLLAVLGGLALPMLAGLVQTLRAAFGILPALGQTDAGLAPWAALAAQPGFWTSLRLTLVTGIGSTLLALVLAAGGVALIYGRAGQGARWLAPFLAAPHVALAIGLAFLLAPSGWIARGVAPVAGWERPPDLASVNDPWGGALILGLLVKEVPFLMLVLLSALGQLPVRQWQAAGRALGYGRGAVWLRVILPRAYALIRLPVFVVLAFALTVVDVAIVLGPSNPPTLAVAVMRMYADPDARMILPASAGAAALGLIVAGAIALWWGAERAVASLGRAWLRRGGRGGAAGALLAATGSVVPVLMALGALAMTALVIWSVAWRWPWPHVVPESLSLRAWTSPGQGWGRALAATVWLAVASTLLSLTLAIAWLEGEDRGRRTRARWATALIYLPLLVPQIAVLYGLQVIFLQGGIGAGMAAVLWAQVIFVFPYVMLALSDPWRAMDKRMIHAAAALGARPLRRLVAVKLPLMLRPILTAGAIGVAVSVAQYLPTLFMGAGRVATLTTEAVTLSSGSDRRILGVYAVLQAALPSAAYALALALPALVWRHRRGMGGEGTA
ncbi:MAG TPA: ABC transporter permease subunit [Paracoccaceae bacterium]|nr:ABC transporter permease subunit [Paracoccaceae bacterium]